VTADLLIRDVEIVQGPGSVHVDIEATAGTVTAIVPAGSGGRAALIIDGSGREAYPGAIDPHVHFRAHPSMNVAGDDIHSVGRAAVKGGVTSFIAFVLAPENLPGVRGFAPVFEPAPDVAADYGFHAVLWPQQAHLDAIPALCEAGIRSYKLFMAYPERGFMFTGPDALRALSVIGRSGGLALLHAEDGHTIQWIDERHKAASPDAGIREYLRSRPANLEAAAIHLAGLWAEVTACPIHIVHLSTAPGVVAVDGLRRTGMDLTVETCPQYLALDEEALVAAGPLAKFAPVLREPPTQEALWAAIERGTVQIIASDHAGHCASVKTEAAAEGGIFAVPFGSPGLETLFAVAYTYGVIGGRISRAHFVDLISANAARRFGWFPRKGAIEVGSDADIVIIDADERPVQASDLISRAGYSLYDGLPLTGWPSVTVRRGQVVYDASHGLVASSGGRFTPTNPHRLGE
jgi:dihydropyrimidinase